MADGTGYRFEPLNRRGVVLGLSLGQLSLLVVAILVAAAILKRSPGLAGFGGATGVVMGAALACRPVAGRTPLYWFGCAVAFAVRGRREVQRPPVTTVSAARTLPSAPPSALPCDPVKPRLPSKTFVPGVFLDELPATGGQGAVGVVVDAREGTAAALLRARGSAFCLLDGPDKERRLTAWAGVLESISSHRGSLARLQWCQRARPTATGALVDHLDETGDRASPGYPGHRAQLEAAGQKAWRHETFLVVTVRCPAHRRRLDDHAAGVLREEVRALRTLLRGAGIACDGVLDAAALVGAVGSFLLPDLDASPTAHPWPLASEERWAAVRLEGAWYRTYWVAEWPRSHVGPDFLSSLLIGRGRRSFSVAMAPVPPELAARDAESSRTAQMADAHLRAQGGFLETARQRRQVEAVEVREEQLAAGRGAFQFSGFVTVAGSDRESLQQGCSDLERAAGAARLCLRPLFGQQREALSWALPLGRGI